MTQEEFEICRRHFNSHPNRRYSIRRFKFILELLLNKDLSYSEARTTLAKIKALNWFKQT